MKQKAALLRMMIVCNVVREALIWYNFHYICLWEIWRHKWY